MRSELPTSVDLITPLIDNRSRDGPYESEEDKPASYNYDILIDRCGEVFDEAIVRS